MMILTNDTFVNFDKYDGLCFGESSKFGVSGTDKYVLCAFKEVDTVYGKICTVLYSSDIENKVQLAYNMMVSDIERGCKFARCDKDIINEEYNARKYEEGAWA